MSDDSYIIENWAFLSPSMQELCRVVGVCPSQKNPLEPKYEGEELKNKTGDTNGDGGLSNPIKQEGKVFS